MNRLLHQTLGGLLDRMAEERPRGEALVNIAEDRRLSYIGFSRQTDELARALIALGIEPGDRLALWGGSTISWILFQYAAAKAGIIVVSADPDYDRDSMAYLLKQSEADALVMIEGYKDRDYATVIKSILDGPDPPDRLKIMIRVGAPAREGFLSEEEFISLSGRVNDGVLAARKASVKPDDVTLISYTSGTTGAPKGVMCTHFGLINKSYQTACIQELTPEDRTGLIVPLYHMFGNTCAVLTGLTAGGAIVLTGRHFEAGEALKNLAQGRCSILYGAPSQFIALMGHPLYGEVDISTLRGGIMGGAPCPMEVMKQVVDDMGVRRILVGYGQTEASSWVTLTRPDDPLEIRVSSIGRTLDHTEVKVTDPKTGDETAPGQTGEMCTKGFLMAGYYNMPAATAGAVDADGWLHTGDLATMDETGNFKVLGRIKELISGPEGDVSPVDVEEALYGHEDIREAAAFGLPSNEDGKERVAVWVKLWSDAALTVPEVIEYCRSRLPAGAVPSFVHFTDGFPMTATGKIRKFKMKELSLEMLEKS